MGGCLVGLIVLLGGWLVPRLTLGIVLWHYDHPVMAVFVWVVAFLIDLVKYLTRSE